MKSKLKVSIPYYSFTPWHTFSRPLRASMHLIHFTTSIGRHPMVITRTLSPSLVLVVVVLHLWLGITLYNAVMSK